MPGWLRDALHKHRFFPTVRAVARAAAFCVGTSLKDSASYSGTRSIKPFSAEKRVCELEATRAMTMVSLQTCIGTLLRTRAVANESGRTRELRNRHRTQSLVHAASHLNPKKGGCELGEGGRWTGELTITCL